MKTLITIIVLVGLASAGALYYSAQQQRDSAKMYLEKAAAKAHYNELSLKNSIESAQQHFKTMAEFAATERDGNRKSGNHISADQLYESTMARLARERDDAINEAKEKYR